MSSDPLPAISCDVQYQAAPLIVAFAGIQSAFGLPHFEFARVLQPLRANKILLRDAKQSWYQRGLSSEVDSLEAVSEFLKEKVRELQPTKVLFTGNSMGGFASILFAALTGAHEVVAFSPQTFITPFARAAHFDYRWPRQIRASRRSPNGKRYGDLREVLRQRPCSSRISIYFGQQHRLDAAHANHLRPIDNVALFPQTATGHNVVRSLRDEGRLSMILRDAAGIEADIQAA